MQKHRAAFEAVLLHKALSTDIQLECAFGYDFRSMTLDAGDLERSDVEDCGVDAVSCFGGTEASASCLSGYN